ncbi:Adenine DNA glycosylase [Glycine soja]|uniref:Adenine DNA glycosylase n=1 Tax=Glycine soja TaxID=3848 RepID=A0A445GDT1_GLYSO|nr:Adenine DNA glycosylase [Glycine soja]
MSVSLPAKWGCKTDGVNPSEFCHALSNAKHDSTVAVTDYPVKGVKVKQRCDFSAVCVVELVGAETLDKNQSSSKFILVKRPEEGLLAGLWEFPSVLLDGEAVPLARREAMDPFLKKNLKIDIRKTCNIVLREDIGEFVHIFSHIRLKLYVELLVLQLKEWPLANSFSSPRLLVSLKMVNLNFYCIAGSLFIEFRCTTWFKTSSRKLFLLTMCQPKREVERPQENSLEDQICRLVLAY